VEVLPDLVASEPVVVFCGMASTRSCKVREHHYATPGNNFWEMLHASGFVERRLRPEEDEEIVSFGLGLTDLVRDDELSPPTYELDALVAKVRTWRPEILAFSSKTVAAVVARELGHRRPGLGQTGWELAGAEVYVLPGTSGANRRREYDGRPDRLSWWVDLAQLAGRTAPG
jgi:TDG/mug DNA glycosylase family protein